MFLLRRAAVRALSQQSNALPRTYQPASSRVTSFSQSGSKPIAWRGFHQARIWRAEEEQKGEIAREGGASPAENEGAAAPVTAEPSVEEQQTEVKEESIATPEAADAATQTGSSAETVAEKAKDVAADSVQGFAEAAESGAAAMSAATSSQPRRSAPETPRMPTRPQHDTLSTHRNPRPSRILYVGNLFFEVNAQQLEGEFAAFGQISNSRIVTDARGLSKGFGYIEFAEQEDADRAVRELDQRVFQGRRMAVQYHVPRERATGPRPGREQPKNPPSKTLFIGNMSYQMSDRDLNDLFREIRDVLDVRVAIDRRSGQPRGFAHADFIDVQSAERAKEHLEKKEVYGRRLKVDFSSSSVGANRDP